MKQKCLKVPHHFIYSIITLLDVVNKNPEIMKAFFEKITKEVLEDTANTKFLNLPEETIKQSIKEEINQLITMYDGLTNKISLEDIAKDGFSVIFSSDLHNTYKSDFGDMDFGDFDINLN